MNLSSNFVKSEGTYWSIGPRPWKYERINSETYAGVANMTPFGQVTSQRNSARQIQGAFKIYF